MAAMDGSSGACTVLVRVTGWSMLSVLGVFLINNFLTFWLGWPGAMAVTSGISGALTWLQAGLYAVAFLLTALLASRSREASLRRDSRRIGDFNAWLIRAAFWAVLMIGVVDMVLALLEVEGLLARVFGQALAQELVRQQVRALYVHLPLVVLSLIIAARARTLGFPWLALLIVAAELLMVMLRYIFSYEQSYMSDLVRFWYAALFLLASVHTLREDAHVRVDVLYAHFSLRTRSLVNALGTLAFGMPLCWLVLVMGTRGKYSLFNSALRNFEKTDTGYGMYVQYLMTLMLGLFAIFMLIQLVSYLFAATADYLDAEPGKAGRGRNAGAV